MWSMGNEEGQANTARGTLILSTMKAVATRHDGSRPVSIAPAGAIGTGGLAVCDVAGYNYMDPGAEAFHKAHPDKPVMGTENVSAVGTRGIYVTDRAKGFVSSYDPYTTTGRASAEGWWASAMQGLGFRADSSGQGSIIAASRHPMDGRTSVRSMESSTRAGSRKIPSITTSRGGRRSPCCTSFPIGTGRAWRARRSQCGRIRTSIGWSCS